MDPKNAIERRAPVTLVAEPFSWRPLPSGPADPVSTGLPLREYLRILRKHRWIILTVLAVMVTVVTVVSYQMQPIYASSARLEIAGEAPDLSSLAALFSMLPGDEEFLQTQVRILQSDELAMQTIRSLRLYEKPEFSVRPKGAGYNAPFSPAEEVALIGMFHGRLNVQLIRTSRLIEVRFESADPKICADVPNELASLYIEANFRKKYESTLQAQQWMSGQLTELKSKMEKSHEALVSYERENQIYALSEGQNVTVQKLGQLNQELTVAQGERIAKESQFQMIKSRRLEDLPQVAGNAYTQELQTRLQKLNDDLAEVRTTYGPKYPKVQRLETQVADAKTQIEHEKQQIANRIESEYQAALKREQLLRQAVDAQKAEANIMNEKLVQHSLLKREYETNQQLYDGLLNRMKEAGVSAGMRSNNIHFVDRARPPLAPVRPNKVLNIALSLVVGVILGGVLALFNEYLDNSVKIPEEVEQLIGLPALGVIPAVASISSTHAYSRALPTATSTVKPQAHELATLSQPHSVVSEAYRALRTSILLSTSKHPPQTILITSGQPREGKTTTALNLSITLAQRGDRVVLIDSDLRRPRVHRSFGMSNDVGLSSYLAGVVGIDDLPRAVTHIPNLFVISSGPTPPNPAELLSSEPMVGLFTELRRQFDFIVMDSPPAITVADSMILAAHADGVMLVIHGGVTTRESLRQAHKLLASVNARLLGVVLNNVDIRSADYQYYYTYYYGDYYRHMLEGYGYGHEPEEKSKRGEKKIGA
ncbi:MAG TPA: polysaccharide biosynthesis tyrosine autokinase [Candidatus Acidoferrales bacterium]|nr:polysaccharide biosynthesis tyrosine autokinase [Candidatus Acidoferrales bacterium]